MLALLTVPFVVSAQIWAFVETIAMNFWFPIFYKKINAECLETKILALTDLINIIIPTYLIFLGCAFASSRLFFNIIVADAYRDLWIVLYLGLLFEFFRACTNVFAVGCQINCDLNILKIPYLIGSVFLLFFLAIGHYLTLNVEGVALIVTFASGIVVVAMVRSVHKIYQFKIEPMIWIVGIFFSCIGATTGVIMHSMRLTLPPSVLIVIIYFSIAFILIKNIKKNHGSINRLLSRTQEW